NFSGATMSAIAGVAYFSAITGGARPQDAVASIAAYAGIVSALTANCRHLSNLQSRPYIYRQRDHAAIAAVAAFAYASAIAANFTALAAISARAQLRRTITTIGAEKH